MRKLLIYLFKKDYKSLILHFLISFISILVLPNILYNNEYEMPFLSSILPMVIIFFNLYVFSRSISLITKDFYSSNRYFIFTLPIRRIEIIISKIIYSTLYGFIILFGSIFALYINTGTYINFNWFINVLPDLLKWFPIYLLSGYTFMSIIYLSIVISKILFNSSRITSAVIFIVIAFLISVSFDILWIMANIGLLQTSIVLLIVSLITNYISANLIDNKMDI